MNCRFQKPVAWLVGLLFWVVGFTAEPPGLSVTTDGGFQQRGRPFRGLGVNYYDAFARTLVTPARTNFDAGFAELAKQRIPFARFSAGGYWPVDWGLYQTNRTEHFARLDAVVKSAERHGIGLIPSLFWYAPTVPDLVGEPVSAWSDPGSLTVAFMRQYTREVVTRYRDSVAIWAWELGNEYNLSADLPNAAEHRPAVVPALGTPASRSGRDEVTHDQMRVALREFAREVRKLDPHRAIFSGNAFPRPSAWHQRTGRTWDRDTPEQWNAMLADDHADPVDTLSGRLYSPEDRAALSGALATAAKLRKPLFIGEFGVPGAPTAERMAQFQAMLEELDRQQVQLAALWVFNFDGQADDWNVTAGNPRRLQLEAVSALNRRWQVERSSSTTNGHQ